jgi:hypothetical protein
MSKLIWERELQCSLRGSIEAIEDPFEDAFYISDGWGTSYSSLCLRKISMKNGDELGKVLLKQSARCMFFYPDGQHILVATDKRLFLLDRKTLEVIKKWDKIGCMCPSYILADDESAYMMNYRNEALTVFQFNNEEYRKIKVGSCGGMFFDSSNNILIFSNKDGKLSKYYPHSKKLEREIDTHIHVECEYSKALNLAALSLGDPYEIEQLSEQVTTITAKISNGIIRIYNMNDSFSFVDYVIPFKFMHFRMSSDFKAVFLSNKESLAIYSLEDNKIIFRMQAGSWLYKWDITRILPIRKAFIACINDREVSKIAVFSFE